MSQQTTLAKTIGYRGVGLHSGKDVTITLNPAPADSGVVFVRTDLKEAPRVKACASNVTSTLRATTLEDGAAKVFTVEHLLAAFFAMGIDNCLVEISAAEPPVADGSALPFARMLQEAGFVELAARRRYIEISSAVVVRYPDRFIAMLPYDGLRISFTSVNPHPLVGIQYRDFEITPDVFIKEIAPARTIGFMHEVDALQAQGLALGGNLENAVVYDDDKILTPLRFSDELVRHKILDVLGDLALAGFVRGHVVAVKSGHTLNTALAQQILASVQK